MNTIFSDENCYYAYDYTAVDGYNNAAAHIVHFPEGVTGKYVVCAVSEPAAGYNSRALRVSVFGLYGVKNVTVATSDADFATYKAANITGKANLLVDKYPVEFNTRSMGGEIKDGTTWKIRLTTASAGIQNTNMLTNDNDDDGSVYFGNDGEKAGDSTTKVTSLVDQEDNYVELIYKLDGKAEISDISLYWMNMNLYSAQHYIVSLADTQEDVFGSKALNIERTTASCAAVMTMNDGITAKYIGVKILCGIADGAKNVIAQNNSGARFGHLDVHGTYVDTIEDSDVTVTTEAPGVIVGKSNLAVVDGIALDANGNYPVGAASTTLTVDKLTFNADKIDYTFAGWKLAGGEIIEGSNVASFTYTPDSVPCELVAVYEGVKEAVANVNLANITFDKYKENHVTGKANLIAGKLPTAYNGRSMGGEVVNCLGYKSKLTATTSTDSFNTEMLTGGGSQTNIYFANEGTKSSSKITNLVDREDNYLEFIYALDGNAKISDVSIYWYSLNEFAAKHYIVSMASVQEALFTEDALTVEVKESALTSSIAPKEETIVGFIGVRVICGVSDAIIGHPSYTDNYATARLGRLDVHGTYVNAIGNDDITVSTEAPGVNVAKSDIAGINADAAGKYPLGLAKTTLTVDKTTSPMETLITPSLVGNLQTAKSLREVT